MPHIFIFPHPNSSLKRLVNQTCNPAKYCSIPGIGESHFSHATCPDDVLGQAVESNQPNFILLVGPCSQPKWQAEKRSKQRGNLSLSLF